MNFECKARALRIGGSVVARTPILLPAFSSKAPLRKLGGKISDDEVQQYVARLGETIAGPLLISASDIHHGHLPRPDADEAPFKAPLTFIDSGGYEGLHDGQLHLGQEEYNAVLQDWPVKAQAVATNIDCPDDDLGNQIATAQAIPNRPMLGKELLLKPGPLGLDYLVSTIPKFTAALSELSVIGVTEKEAGLSLKERLSRIRELRRQLDDAGLGEMPIHVFGGLDPMRSYLYFLAGGDIFDGTSWLRFGFENGNAFYLDALASLRHCDLDIGESEWLVRRQNIFEIADMQVAMRKFLASGKLAELHPNAAVACPKLFS